MKLRNLLPLLLAFPLTVQADDTLASLEIEARSLLAQGRTQGRSMNLNLGSCMQRMRALQPQVRQLQARVEALPEPLGDKIWLALAANHLHLCVSCDRQGPEFCDKAAESLDNSGAR
jgi:hypothetical protein